MFCSIYDELTTYKEELKNKMRKDFNDYFENLNSKLKNELKFSFDVLTGVIIGKRKELHDKIKMEFIDIEEDVNRKLQITKSKVKNSMKIYNSTSEKKLLELEKTIDDHKKNKKQKYQEYIKKIDESIDEIDKIITKTKNKTKKLTSLVDTKIYEITTFNGNFETEINKKIKTMDEKIDNINKNNDIIIKEISKKDTYLTIGQFLTENEENKSIINNLVVDLEKMRKFVEINDKKLVEQAKLNNVFTNQISTTDDSLKKQIITHQELIKKATKIETTLCELKNNFDKYKTSTSNCSFIDPKEEERKEDKKEGKKKENEETRKDKQGIFNCIY